MSCVSHVGHCHTVPFFPRLATVYDGRLKSIGFFVLEIVFPWLLEISAPPHQAALGVNQPQVESNAELVRYVLEHDLAE